MNSSKNEITKDYILNVLDALIASFLAEVSQIRFNKHNLQELLEHRILR